MFLPAFLQALLHLNPTVLNMHQRQERLWDFLCYQQVCVGQDEVLGKSEAWSLG